MIRWIRNFLLGIILLGLIIFFFLAGTFVDRQRNTTILSPGEVPEVSAEARRLHRNLVIADWHSDNLLWDRDILSAHSWGHVDIPRLIQGGISIQVFDAVIKTPRGLNYESNSGSTDNITLLAMANRWPVSTWFNLTERALHQSKILHDAAEASPSLSIIRNQSDLDLFLKLRNSNTNLVGGILSIEGMHALEGDIENFDVLYEAGYRIMGLVHFFDNDLGGSSSGIEKGGLTPFGQQVVRRMDESSIIIDLAHASEKLVDETLRLTKRPVIVSHTGVSGTFQSPRNLSDDQLKKIAERGGMIGIGFWEGAVGGTDVSSIVRAISHAVEVAGIDHVGLGSDFDGTTKTYFDASQIILLTEGLLQAGFNHDDITKIMGGNQVKFLMSYLPPS